MSETRGSDQPRRVASTPFVVEPISNHTHSLILLHGLGSNGFKFGAELLDSGKTSDGKTLTELFPGARFIFPTAKRRRSSAFRRAMLTQWFDIASLEDPSHRSHTQLQGLEQSSREILALIEHEVENVPRENIIIGGISQGCAMAFSCLLALGSPIGGFIGMSGWLPFATEIDELLNIGDELNGSDEDLFSDNENSFESSEDDERSVDAIVKVHQHARELLALQTTEDQASKDLFSTPIFLGHGEADPKVNPALGEEACRILRSVGFEVSWKCYEGLGHWYKIPDEIDDIVEFIEKKTQWAK
ncbi:hypothetical protein FZEAL_605 [Fusarium zealandicum]|uniref:Phospholipase/carboxylesterase/thioesterase domain-containing protein n=1 Tax=Fusarium zealandicum TaxID=1053134 RepID=A0A8H4XPN4_9HYPO|nr:hypothetical protein FZEAL_605 [Fusarium zealandicum]